VLVSAGLVRDGGSLVARHPGRHPQRRGPVDEPLVRDGNWVSSRSPLDLLAFERGMIELFESAPRRNRTIARPRPFARYRPRSRLAFLLGVGLHMALRRALPAAV
jgi:protease I